MTKMNKYLSVLLCTAVITSVFSSPVDADFAEPVITKTVPFVITAPENAETFEYGYLHTEYYGFAEGTYKSIGEDVSYRDKEYVNRVYIPYEWEAQHVHIKLDGCSSDVSEAVTAIVEKYSDELSGLETSEREGVYFLIEDVIDEKTSDMPETVEDKSKAVMDMCREITAAGGKITEAVYSPYIIGYGRVKLNGIYIYGFPGTEEEFNAYVADISDSLNISPEDAIPEDMVGSVLPDSNHFTVVFERESPYLGSGYTTDAAAVAEVYKFWEAIRADYPECAIRYYEYNPQVSADSGGGTTVNYGEVNILTAIQEEESCDTNQSGAVDLDDAVQVLTHYANTAAGIAPAAETADMDVNGDGSVTLDDAVKVLAVYAELAAGLR